MKYPHFIMFSLTLLALLIGVGTFPLIKKRSTEVVLQTIERDFVRPDLTEQENKEYQSEVRWIRQNENVALSAYKRCLLTLTVLSCLSFIFCAFDLIKRIKSKRKPNKKVSRLG